MKLTIIGPEGNRAEIEEMGDYYIGRSPGWGRVTSITGSDGESQPIAEGHTSVSRDHLRVLISDDGVVLGDRGSTMGSFLEDERFDTEHLTHSGQSKLRLGSVEFRLAYEM
ncbi:hypothetical protein CMI41_02800 [Candidatus Pacearchaeota archaeon]|nr:hypothetical protein [Candidatus Pacearchaeota archaeon]|tara:strand:+ start:306 stop:638 length:333 start_codon:yes stop_codon:yes gene_type:complete